MYLYCVHFYIATNKAGNPYCFPSPFPAFASASSLPPSCASTVLCATQGDQEHCTYLDEKLPTFLQSHFSDVWLSSHKTAGASTAQVLAWWVGIKGQKKERRAVADGELPPHEAVALW